MQLGRQKRAIRLYSPEEELELAQQKHALRKAQLQWCKERALAELPNIATAISSMVNDSTKSWWDAEGNEHPFLFDWTTPVYQSLLQHGVLFATKSVTDMRRWIEGFN